MNVLVSGSSGLIGTALIETLRAHGHETLRLVRRDPQAGEVRWDPTSGVVDTAKITASGGIDAAVNLAGAGIGDHRWTDEYKREILDSRVRTTDLLARTLAALDQKPSVFVSGSAIGIYGNRGDEELTEESETGSDFLADVCRQWEGATAPASAAGIPVVHIRTGIVLSAKGGALRKQLPLFRFGLGGRFGNGRQWQSWISIDDEVGAIVHLLSHPLAGAVNLTSPNAVTNTEFTQTLARVLKRPALLPIPKFGPSLLLGSELAESLLYSSQQVRPTVLLAAGYQFVHPDLEGALRALLHK